jgi:DNA-binding transcriptional ArsR family regulator
MAEDDSFLLVNLKESKSKELAQVIGSDSCRKILDYLANNKKASESEIAKDLKQPLSTIHYNLQNLYKAGLVVAEEFHYSEKGKEVNHYSLAKKIIIIAPEGKSGFMEKLKKVLPLTIFAVVGAGLIQAFTFFSRSGANNLASGNNIMMAKSAAMDTLAQETAAAPMRAISYSAPVAQSEPSIALWFLLGSMSVVLFVLIMSIIKKK